MGIEKDMGKMSLAKYDHWFQAIKNNDQMTVDKELKSATIETKNMLLNWQFDFLSTNNNNEGVSDQEAVYSLFQATHPITLAVVYQSHNVISSLIKHEVNVRVKEINGNNILHMLCYVAYSQTEKEQEFQQTFCLLKNHLQKSDLEFLLMSLNNQELRPLELAAHLGLLGLFDEIFHTPGIYMEEFQRGMFTEQWFDVTEYEQIDIPKRGITPLLLITFLDEGNLNKSTMKTFFQKQHIKMWMNSKIKANYMLVFIWFIRKIILFAFFFLLDSFSLTLEENTMKQGANENASLFANKTMEKTSCLASETLYMVSYTHTMYIAVPLLMA